MAYYNVFDDLDAYPDAWCTVVFSKRGPGKTYSMLLGALKRGIKIVYMKRSASDVDLITNEKIEGSDMNPYKSIMRDHPEIHVAPTSLDKGIAVIHEVDDEGQPTGTPVAFVLSVSTIYKYRGFDLSDYDIICYDEFMPLLSQRRIKKEGEGLLDLYMTVSRDREKRGKPPVKLVLFSNTDTINGPVLDTLEITDDIAAMQNDGDTIRYLENRGILIHHLREDKYRFATGHMRIEDGMKDTAWARAALGGEFAYTDFTNVRKIKGKNYQPIFSFTWRRRDYVVSLNYEKARYHIREQKNKEVMHYDLSRENDQKRFFAEVVIDLRQACIDNRVTFETYTLYNLIINYKEYFEV